jgi:secreted trypsin-like serine protease
MRPFNILRGPKRRAGAAGGGKALAAAVAIGLLVTTGLNPAAAQARPPPAAQARPHDLSIEIVGGQRVLAGEFPWVVKLSTGCAGTLVHARYVLTAAHCVGGASRRTGSVVETAAGENLSSPRIFEVHSRAVVRARGFRSVTEGSDWAVVQLAEAVNLPVVELATSAASEGVFTTVGWGSVREGTGVQQTRLRKVEVPFVPDAACDQIYQAEGYGLIPSHMMCAGDIANGGRDACQGDSGGPLLRRADGRWIQVGIVSWGVGCGRRGLPGVYTEVSQFVGDIRAAIQ